MPPQIATIVCFLGILWLFKLDRDREAITSTALWLPVTWLMINGSRAVSQWLATFGLGSAVAMTPEQHLEGSPLDRNIYLVLTLLAILVLLGRQQKTGAFLRANLPILLFFFYCALSILWSEFPDVAFKRWIKAVGDLAMILVVLTDRDPLAAVKRLFSRVGFVLLPLSILFIKYYPNLGRDYHNVFGITVNLGVTTSKNLLGMITLILGLGSEWCFLQAFRHRMNKKEKGPLIAHGVLLAMAMWLFWQADSATSLSCFLLGGGLMAVMSLHRLGRKSKVVKFLMLIAVSVPLIALFLESGAGLLGAVGRDSTLTGRTDIWKLVLSMSGNPLFGTGFESFWLGERSLKVWNIYRFHLNEAHNGYIEVYLNLGWVGIAMLALLLTTGYRNLMAAFSRNSDIVSLKLAYFVVAVVYNLSESGFRILNPVWLFFFFAIIAVPEASVPQHPLLIEIDRTDASAKGVPQLDHVPSVGFCKGAI